MPLALGPGSNPNAYIPPYPGAAGVRPALSEYMREFYGPGMQVDPSMLNSAAGDYYSTPTTGDISGGAQATAQRSFGNLIGGQGAAMSSAAQQNAQRKQAAGSGINATASTTGNVVGEALGAKLGLLNAQSQAGMQNLGLLSSLIGSFSSPTGSGTNLVNSFTGNTSGASGLGQAASGGGNLLSSLIWPSAGGSFAAGGGLDTVLAGGADGRVGCLPSRIAGVGIPMNITDLNGPIDLSRQFSRSLSEFLRRGPDFTQPNQSFGSMVSNPQLFMGPGGTALDPIQNQSSAATSYLGNRLGVSQANQQQKGNFADLLLGAGSNIGNLSALMQQLQTSQQSDTTAWGYPKQYSLSNVL